MRYGFTLLLMAILVTALCPMTAEAASSDTETVRVVICKGVESVRIEGYGIEVADGKGTRLQAAFPLVLRRDRNGVSFEGSSARSLILSSPGFIQVNGKGYRGKLEVVPAEKGLVVIDDILLEDYLVGLINCEISSQWPLEAVKAQAVIARSYAIYQKEARKKQSYHLESTVYDQVYNGCDLDDSRAARAVEETRGEVLTYNGKVVQAFFHSSCGGHTEASENVWSVKLPYLRGVDCTYCMKSPSVLWEQAVPRKKMESLLRAAGYQIGTLKGIRPKSHLPSGRIDKLELVTAQGAETISAAQFRKIVGYGVIRSTRFEVSYVDGDFVFIGVGYGHGVGLCQWGAKQRAEEGFTYREILSYYYPGTRIGKYYTE